MGMFDSVIVCCPKCGENLEFQSKAGPCCLRTYTINEVPTEIAADIDGDSEYCSICEDYFIIELETEVPKTVRMKLR
jgi:hypothetical protein